MYLKKAIRRDCSPILKNGLTRLLTYLKKRPAAIAHVLKKTTRMRIAFSSCIFNFNYDVLFARSRFRKLLQFLRALPAGETPAGFVYIFLQYHYITPVRGSQMQNKNFLPSRASAVSKLIRPHFNSTAFHSSSYAPYSS